jgi:tRNA-splicing ligase RtcB
MSGFEYIETGGSPIKAWTRGVPIEDAARADLVETSTPCGKSSA